MNPRVLEIPGSLIREVAAKKRPTSIDLGLGEPVKSFDETFSAQEQNSVSTNSVHRFCLLLTRHAP